MLDVRWLTELPPPLRWGLSGAVFGACAVGTGAPADGPAALGIAGATAAALFGGWWLALRERAAAPAVDPLSERHRGILARQALAWVEEDPSFSLPDVVERLRDVLLPRQLGGPVEIGPVTRVPPTTDSVDTLEIVVAYQTPATSSSALVVLGRDGDDWAIRRMETADGPLSPAAPSPWITANRRALLARSEAFDRAGFEAMATRISELLDQPDVVDGELRPWTTPTGLSSIRWWRDHGGLPAANGPLTWLAVYEDAWYERVDLRCGDRCLGLLRRAGDPAAPWALWRVLRAPEEAA